MDTVYTAIEQLPRQEAAARALRAQALLAQETPRAGGLMCFSRLTIYYFTGSLAGGLLWLPAEGEPVLLVRRGLERVRLESPLAKVATFRSYGDIVGTLADFSAPLGDVVAAEMGGLPWSLAQLLLKKLPETRFENGDRVVALARSVKTDWELAKMRLCGARHHKALHDILPQRIEPGMTERQISHAAWNVFFELGHTGMLRMGAPGEEIFLGHVAAGDNANYPSHFNGPVGLKGEHPAAPFMGYAGSVWREGEPLTVDIGFGLEGYATDKTQVYWGGPTNSVPDAARRAQDFCVEVQARTAEALKPGALPSELYARAMDMASTLPEDLRQGFMALGGNKVSFLGHGIGLAIDEFPVLAKGFDAPLETGMCLALEPKLGIPGLGMVGVENTFEVTPEGGRCLTGDAYDMVCVG